MLENTADTYLFKKNFHQDLEQEIYKLYGVQTKFSKVISWGYQSTAVYIEAINSQKYLVKISPKNKDRLKEMKKDIVISLYLKSVLLTSEYLKSKNAEYIENFNEYYMRFQKYIEGTVPFDIDLDILSQMIEKQKIIHSQATPDYEIGKIKNPKNEYVLLHGDMTPSNVLVSFGKITGVLDFDYCTTGPIEWDLARTAVFSWLRMQSENFNNLCDRIIHFYNCENLDKTLFNKYARVHASQNFLNIKNNRNSYKNLQKWESETDFAKNALNTIKKVTS